MGTIFAFSFRVPKKKTVAVCLAVGIVALGACLLRDQINSDIQETSKVATAANLHKFPKVKNNQQRVALLQELQWEVEEEPIEIEEIIIPENFDDVYENYNALQQQMGLDLKEYKGKRCKRYTYVVKNPPNHTPMWIDLILYKDRIIGGSAGTRELGGHMQSLLREE